MLIVQVHTTPLVGSVLTLFLFYKGRLAMPRPTAVLGPTSRKEASLQHSHQVVSRVSAARARAVINDNPT